MGNGPPPAGRLRRAAVLAVCLAATAALHGLALHGATRVLGGESLGRRAAPGAPRPVRLVARDAPATTPAATAPARPRGIALAAAEQPGQRTAVPSASTGARPARPGTAPDAPPDADSRADGYRFYAANEVDVTAEPVLDWNLEPAALDALATSRIVFTLFVGRDGRVLHCSVDEPERLTPAERRALEARLVGTEMRPARRAGQPVPSRRRVELYSVGG